MSRTRQRNWSILFDFRTLEGGTLEVATFSKHFLVYGTGRTDLHSSAAWLPITSEVKHHFTGLDDLANEAWADHPNNPFSSLMNFSSYPSSYGSRHATSEEYWPVDGSAAKLKWNLTRRPSAAEARLFKRWATRFAKKTLTVREGAANRASIWFRVPEIKLVECSLYCQEVITTVTNRPIR